MARPSRTTSAEHRPSTRTSETDPGVGISWQSLASDLRHGLRLIVRQPLFATGVVVLLALGIGATTVVFSLIDAVLLTPMPYSEPDRLVMIWETQPNFERMPLSGPNFLDFNERSRSFDSMAAVWAYYFSLTGGDEPVRLGGCRVTSELFDVVRVEPELGRGFQPADEREGAEPVAIVGHGLWQRSFGGSPDVIGKSLQVNGETHAIVGVMPADFKLMTPWTRDRDIEILLPLTLSPALDSRDDHSYMAIARLGEGVTLESAQAEMDTIAADLEAAYPTTNKNYGSRVAALHSEMVGRTGNQLLMLMVAAICVLLIACANVGGLMLAKAASRENELAVRFSLGAGRGRLVVQLLAEYLPLAFLGGVLGSILAWWALDGLRFLVPRAPSGSADYGIQFGTLVLVSLLSLILAVLLGVLPTLGSSALQLAESLNQGRGSLFAGPRRARVYRTLIVVQLALTLMLANGAALMLVSYSKLQRTDHGFDPAGVIAVPLHLAGPSYDSAEKVLGLLRELGPRIRSLPGVEVAGTTSKLPLDGGTNGEVAIEGREGDWEDQLGPLAEQSFVTPGYFRAMSIGLLRGRLLEAQDLGSETAVAVVNKTFADLAWSQTDPIGKRFAIHVDHQWITVVGVVGDVQQWGAEYPALPEYYLPFGPHPAYWTGWRFWAERQFLILRSNQPLSSLRGALREEIRSLAPEQSVSEIETLDEVISSATLRRRFNTLLISIFSLVSIILVAMGVFGMMSTFVTQRQHEIGVRMALGADHRRVLRLVFGYSIRLLGIGLLAGLAVTLLSGRLMESLLYAVDPADPFILVAGTAFVLLIGLLGAFLPALRAARVDPVAALRSGGN
jgi:putative ABC transport system permease protein